MKSTKNKKTMLKTMMSLMAAIGIGTVVALPTTLASLEDQPISTTPVNGGDIEAQTVFFENTQLNSIGVTPNAGDTDYSLEIKYNVPTSDNYEDSLNSIQVLFFENDGQDTIDFDYTNPSSLIFMSPTVDLNSPEQTLTINDVLTGNNFDSSASQNLIAGTLYYVVFKYVAVVNTGNGVVVPNIFYTDTSSFLLGSTNYEDYDIDLTTNVVLETITDITMNTDPNTGISSADLTYNNLLNNPVAYPGGVNNDTTVVPFAYQGVDTRVWVRAVDTSGLNPNEWVDAGVDISTDSVDGVITVPGLALNETFEFRINGSYGSVGNPRLFVGNGNIVSGTTRYAEPRELTAVTGSTAGEIDLTWDWNSTQDATFYFAVRDVLFPDTGWKVYSSSQTNQVTINADGTSATIVDPSFIIEGNEYDISLAGELATESRGIQFYGTTAWENWDLGTLGGPNADIIINSTTQYVTAFALPEVIPTVTVSNTASNILSNSITFSFTYNNGTIVTNPIVTATVEGIAIIPTEFNVVFNPEAENPNLGTGTIELLRLTPDVDYSNIEFIFDYGYTNGQILGRPTGTYSTPNGTPLIEVATFFDTETSSYTVNVAGDYFDDSTVGTPGGIGTGDIQIYDTSNLANVRTLTDLGAPTLSGTHTFDLTGFNTAELNVKFIIEDNDGNTITNVNQVFISDGASGVESSTIYTMGTNDPVNLENAIISPVTAVESVEGPKRGEVNISWNINYPQGISLSNLGLVFEISTVNPAVGANWIDVTDQTIGISTNLKSATITGLLGDEYIAGVWVRLTVEYINQPVTNSNTVETSVSVVPTQPEERIIVIPSNWLFGVIIGVVAGIALLGIGGIFIMKKKGMIERPTKKDGNKTSTSTKATLAKEGATTTTTTKVATKPITKAKKPPTTNDVKPAAQKKTSDIDKTTEK